MFDKVGNGNVLNHLCELSLIKHGPIMKCFPIFFSFGNQIGQFELLDRQQKVYKCSFECLEVKEQCRKQEKRMIVSLNLFRKKSVDLSVSSPVS